jgi:CMP-N,N'-diacetyllegionaminic acid synthase
LKRLASICARGGSKGVINKNLRVISGKPLLAYSILQARASGLFDLVVVSSDEPAILAVAMQYGADQAFRRPDELASDHSAKLPAIIHCAKAAEGFYKTEYDIFVDLDCTSPLRNIEDIKASVALLENSDASNVITGSRARRSPYFNLVERDPSGMVRPSKKLATEIIRRQDAPECFDMNASIYAWKRADFFYSTSVFQEKTRLYEMPESRSWDIDSEMDLEFVAFLITRRSDLLEL